MEIDEDRFGYVYRVTNLLNGKSYVGKHRIKPGEEWHSYLGSGTAIVRALRKYGRKNFSKELLGYADSEAELSAFETELINQDFLNRVDSYNILSSKSEEYSRKSMLYFDRFDVLKMYFDDKLSMSEIGDIIGVSQPAIHAYLKKFRDTDERFTIVTQGKPLGVPKSQGRKISEHQKLQLSQRMKRKSKIPCETCGELFTEGGTITTHRKSCQGHPWPLCEICNKKLSKRSAKRCKECKYLG